jgi:hypothetical protein
LLGYPVDTKNGAESDFEKVTVDAADYDFTGKVNTTNKTLDVGTTADGADVLAIYETAAGASIPAEADFHFMVIGSNAQELI